MPIPGGEFETSVLLNRKMPGECTGESNSEENCSNDDVKPMESGRHEKGCAVD
jgi:hypothetical protein